jgi:twitching motility protein PilU
MYDIRSLLSDMVARGASDLYLTADSPPVIRVEGLTEAAGDELLAAPEVEELANALMTERQRLAFEEKMEMNLALASGRLGRFRVNVFRQRGAVAVVVRQIKVNIPSIDDLGLPQSLKTIVLSRRGLVLVTGATGSGKSTTQAAMIDYRNEHTHGHIVTIEDPIEFVHPHKNCLISQREVGFDTISFNEALRNALRQAPDLILIGEVRDLETMEAAITFAETGHLCLATLHSNNANQAIERVMNFFPAQRHPEIHLQLSLNLRAIISQRLIQGVDGKRVATLEILIDTPRVKDLIKKGEVDVLKEAMQQSTLEGGQTFDQAIFDLYRAGRIEIGRAHV